MYDVDLTQLFDVNFNPSPITKFYSINRSSAQPLASSSPLNPQLSPLAFSLAFSLPQCPTKAAGGGINTCHGISDIHETISLVAAPPLTRGIFQLRTVFLINYI